jgi:release factor glutamine methyltransferase
MMVRDALRAATEQLIDSDTARLDAELLMAHALGISRDALLVHQLDGLVPVGFDALLRRRIAHEPLAYITGTRDFWTITLGVAPGVLIPRPDSETLIEAAVAHFGATGPTRVLDLGTGSGALLLAALHHWPKATGLGIDISEAALAIAQKNAAAIAPGRATMRIGDWATGIAERFDLILCNPPYVETDASLSLDVLREPHAALFSGADGLDDYRRIIPQLATRIAPHGLIAMEIGYRQASAVQMLFAEQEMATSSVKDLGGRDRAILHFALGKRA